MNPKERFIAAALNQEVDRPPVWMMRQAGRYLPEYRAFKKTHTTKQMMQTPEIAAEITIQPVDIVGVDAAILYSDILMIPDAMGMGLDFAPGEGPRFEFAIQNEDNLNKLNEQNLMERLSYVFEAARLCVKQLPQDFPLLGFAGAPFTVACYMIAGGSEKEFPSVRKLLETNEKVFHGLMEKLTRATQNYLIEQANAGAVTVQLFDTWAGLLSAEEYKKWAYPYSKTILETLDAQNIPSIHFIKGGSHHFDTMKTMPSKVIGLDWTMSLKDAFQRVNGQYALQGNFDPTWLMESKEVILEKLQSMLGEVPNLNKGYILNLGHGIDKATLVENAKFFVEKAKELGTKL